MFVPISDDVLEDLDTRFGRIAEHTPAPLPPGRWSKRTPEPPYQVVFRPCSSAEWREIRAQINDPKRAAGAPPNLAKMTIVGVSFNGKAATHRGTMATATNPPDRAEVWALYDELLEAWPGVPELVLELLAALNRGEMTIAEKT